MPVEESLTLNTLTFPFPREPKTFWFSLDGKHNYALTKLNHILFPVEIKTIFPNITPADTIYTSFCRKTEGFIPLQINFETENFNLLKRWYNSEIRHYFVTRGYIVEPTFIKDNQVWLPNTMEKAPKGCSLYDRYTIKVNFNHFTNTPELVLSYDRKAKIYNKSVDRFLETHEGATADLFNKVLHIEYIQSGKGEKIEKCRITKYHKLSRSGKQIDYQNVFPIIGSKLNTFLNPGDSESGSTPNFTRTNRYIQYWDKINNFCNQHLNNSSFREIIPLANNFTKARPTQIGKTTPQSKQLVFGKNHTDVIPQRGINNGPFSQPPYNNIQMFFIAPESHKQHTINLSRYFLRGYKELFKGLKQYTNVPIAFTPKGFSILFSDTADPLPEIEEALENRILNPGVKYIAIYLTPIGKYVQDKQQREIYYKVKEKLLNRNITSQCIETSKMIKVLEEDAKPDKYGRTKNNFAYTLQNMAIAINAKLGGIPWRINSPIQKELIVGVGAFKHISTNTTYIGSAFSFDNTGTFNSFEYFYKDQLRELAGAIENAIINYADINDKPGRLIIHFYKEMGEREIKPIEKTLYNLGLDIPVFVVTINKTESEDYVVFDCASKDLMPYSGTHINLGNNTYLLCNNTRYEGNKVNPMDGYPFPVKLKIHCPSDHTLQSDNHTIQQLINQVYQFSRIYWKSVKQQNLPVTIKYPEMVAQIAPHFTGGDIPANIGKNNLWFL